MNTTYPTTKGYYIVHCVSNDFILKEEIANIGQVIKAGELSFRYIYLVNMKPNPRWYWKQVKHQQILIVSAYTILHPCLEVSVVKDVENKPMSVSSKK